jgi:hypothetical protein
MVAAIDGSRLPPLPQLNNYRRMPHVRNFSQVTLLALQKDQCVKPVQVVAEVNPCAVSMSYDARRLARVSHDGKFPFGLSREEENVKMYVRL